jgi:hypothetical protein
VKWRIAVATVATVVVCSGVVTAVEAEQTDFSVENSSATLNAVDVLKTIRVERENPRGYSRSLFKHWLDVDGDGCDAREQVLKRDALGFAQVDPFKCTVVEADWLSPYDGRRTTDRSQVDIDHVVALKEAWDSGAFAWTEAQRTAFANDTSDSRTLLAVSSSSNRSKSDKDPSNWLPSLRGYWCTYLANWVSVKARWNLSMDESEWGRVNNLLSGQCAGTTMRGWSAPPVAVGSPATTAAPIATTSTTSTTVASTPTTVASAPTTVAASTGTRSATVTTIGSVTATTAASTSTLVNVRPGSFCAPEGALGTYNSIVYVCSKTDVNGTPYSGNRARWRRQV